MKKIISVILAVIFILSVVFTSSAISIITLKSIKSDKATVSIIEGKTYSLKVLYVPANTTQKAVKYSTSNRYVATVDSKGKITAVKPGIATIKITSVANKNISATCKVIVEDSFVDIYKMQKITNITFGKSVNDIQAVFDKFSPSDNPALEMIKEYTNVNMVNKFTLPQEAYQQQINLGIASRDLPNVFAVDVGTATELIRNELLVDMKPYLNKWGSESLKSIYNTDDGVNFLPLTRGDKVYGLPLVGETLDSRFILWIRDDWMKNVGLDPKKDMPKTMEQLFNIARKFVNNDPDKNGAKDTYGIAMSKELQYGNMSINAFLQAFSGYPGVYKKDNNNNFTYLGIAPGMRDGLKALNAIYKEGIFKKDFVTMTMDQAYDDVKAGKVGIVASALFAPMASFQEVWAQTGTNVSCVVMPGLENKEYKFYSPLSSKLYYVVAKGCKNPEALIKVLNNGSHPDQNFIWHKEAWPKYVTKLANSGSKSQLNVMLPVIQSIPNVNYTRAKIYIKGFTNTEMHKDPSLYDILGVGQFPNRVYPSYRYQNIPGFYDKKENRMDGATSSLYPEDSSDKRRLQHKINWGTYKAIIEGTVTAKEGYKATPIKNDWFYADTRAMTKYGSVMQKKEEEMIFGVITNVKTLADWDDYVNKWYPQNGGNDVLESMKEFINKSNSSTKQ